MKQKPEFEFSVFLGEVRVHISEIKVRNEVTLSKNTGIDPLFHFTSDSLW